MTSTKSCERCGREFSRKATQTNQHWDRQRFCGRHCQQYAHLTRGIGDGEKKRDLPPDPLLPILIRYGLKRGPGDNGYSALPGLHWFDLVDLAHERGVRA